MDDLLIQEEITVKTEPLEDEKLETSLYKKDEHLFLKCGFGSESTDIQPKMSVEKLTSDKEPDYLFMDPDGAVDHYEEVLGGQTSTFNNSKDLLSGGYDHSEDDIKSNGVLNHSPKNKNEFGKLGMGYTLECSFCMFTSSTEKVMKNHMLEHIDGMDLEAFVQVSCSNDVYKCLFCPFSSVSSEMFKYHLKFKHVPSRNQILKPDNIFESDDDNDDDDDTIDVTCSPDYKRKNSIMLNCKNCSFGCNELEEMNEHLSKYHPNLLLKCNYCAFSTFNKSAFKIHMETHGGAKRYSCSSCNFSSSSGDAYLHHQSSHIEGPPFLCNDCGFEAKTKQSFAKHIGKHFRKSMKLTKPKKATKPYKIRICQDCGFEAKTTQGFNKHRDKHFRQVHSYPTHSFIKTKDDTYMCDECSFQAKTLQGITKHKDKHYRNSADFPHHFFTSDNEIFGGGERHLTVVKEKDSADDFLNLKVDDMHACNECNFQAKTLQGFNKHMAKHIRNNVQLKLSSSRKSSKSRGTFLYNCDECNFHTRARQALLKHKDKHLRLNHKKNYKKLSKKRKNIIPEQQQKYACSQCPYENRTLHGYLKHKKSHSRNSDDFPFSCVYCHYKATKKSHLTRHVMIHTGEKPYICPHCDYRCNQASTLKVHISRHSTRTMNARLKRHEEETDEAKKRKKNPSRNSSPKKLKSEEDSIPPFSSQDAANSSFVAGLYQCSICDFHCSKFVQLSEHTNTHKNFTSQQPKESSHQKYFCSECNLKFLKKKELRSHYKKSHLGQTYPKNS